MDPKRSKEIQTYPTDANRFVTNEDAVENCSDAFRLNHIPHKNQKFKISLKIQTDPKRFEQNQIDPYISICITRDLKRSNQIQTDPNISQQI